MVNEAAMASFWQEVAAVEEFEKAAFFFGSSKRRRKRAYVNDLNQPASIAQVNKDYAAGAKKLYGKGLVDLTDEESRAAMAYAETQPHIRALRKKHQIKGPTLSKQAAFGGLRSFGRRAGSAMRRAATSRAAMGAGALGALGGAGYAGYAGTNAFLGRKKKKGKKKGMKVGTVPASARANKTFQRLLAKVKSRFPEIPGRTLPWLLYLAMKERGLLK